MPALPWELTAAAWAIAGLATLGVIVRPSNWPEYLWAGLGAGLLVATGLLPAATAWRGVSKGTDVYLFLIGMMVLAELARTEGLFDWIAARAARAAKGSPKRLFSLIYGVGTLVTVLLSNDATAVVLTPAVAAVARTARVRDPLPFLFICAFIANAASFVLPISNPANLVIYGTHMPPLLQWLPRYALPSAAAVGMTYAMLRWSQRAALQGEIGTDIAQPVLSTPGRLAAAGIGVATLVLLAASALDVALGWPTFLAGVATAGVVLARSGSRPWTVVRGVSWGVLPLVAGLFVLVEAMEATGVTRTVAGLLPGGSLAPWASGVGVALGANLVNNLPAGLMAARVVELAQVPEQVRAAVLIGVDLGPNLSITGSLATILWLTALRRDGITVSAGQFMRLGALVMVPALLAALAALVLVPG